MATFRVVEDDDGDDWEEVAPAPTVPITRKSRPPRRPHPDRKYDDNRPVLKRGVHEKVIGIVKERGPHGRGPLTGYPCSLCAANDCAECESTGQPFCKCWRNKHNGILDEEDWEEA